MAILETRGYWLRKGTRGNHLGAWNVIQFYLGGGHTDVCTHPCIPIQYIQTHTKNATFFLVCFLLCVIPQQSEKRDSVWEKKVKSWWETHPQDACSWPLRPPASLFTPGEVGVPSLEAHVSLSLRPFGPDCLCLSACEPVTGRVSAGALTFLGRMLNAGKLASIRHSSFYQKEKLAVQPAGNSPEGKTFLTVLLFFF